MFFDAARIAAVREMILADSEDGRRAALAKLLPEQRRDFAEIFRVMAGLPVTIRLLDPPLHEFLPTREEDFAEVAAAAGEILLARRSEEHTSELQSIMRISYAVFCLKNKNKLHLSIARVLHPELHTPT